MANNHRPFVPCELLTADRLNGMAEYLDSRIDLGRTLFGEPGWRRRPGEAGWNTEHSVTLIDASVPRRLAVRVQHLRVITPRGRVVELEAPMQFVVDLPRTAQRAMLLWLHCGPDRVPQVSATGGPDDVPITRLVEVGGSWRIDPEWLPPAATVASCAPLQSRLAAIARRLHEALVLPNAHPGAEAARATFFAAWFGALGDEDAAPRRHMAVGRQLLAELGRLSGFELSGQAEPAPWSEGLGDAVAEWSASVDALLRHWAMLRQPGLASVEIHELAPVGEFRCLEVRAQPNLDAARHADGSLRITAPLDLAAGAAEVRVSGDATSPLVYERSCQGEIRDKVLAVDVPIAPSAQERSCAYLWICPRSLTKR
jgi:hypothetical protein